VLDGRLGTIHKVALSVTTPGHEAWHPNPRYYYQPGAGPILDLGVYPLTLASTILGPIARVWGLSGVAIPERMIASGPSAGQRFPVEVPDHSIALLQFAQGAVGTLHASFATVNTSMPPVEIHGTNGSLQLGDFHSFTAPLRVCMRGEHEWHEVDMPGPEVAPNWARAIVDLADATREGRRPRMAAEHAAHVLEVMLAIEQSARTEGSSVVITRHFATPVPLDEH
jgi:predicted dehydrogenase